MWELSLNGDPHAPSNKHPMKDTKTQFQTPQQWMHMIGLRIQTHHGAEVSGAPFVAQDRPTGYFGDVSLEILVLLLKHKQGINRLCAVSLLR